jgi:predicted nuclease of predicted toxin-antitoxin system
MRFLIDAQLRPALCGWFEERGFEAEHVSQRLDGQTPDLDIAARAIAQALILVTKDDDFALDTRRASTGSSGSAAATSRIARCANGSPKAGPVFSRS